MPRGATYADNASNRRLGRAGLPMGSCVISKGSSSPCSSSDSIVSNTYADNAYNRSVGRAGLPMGSCVISKGSSSPCSSSDSIVSNTYADNAYNRSVGRAGLPMGSCVISKGSSSPCSSSDSIVSNTYADNAYNRSVGRAGLPMGSCVISKGSSSPSSSSYSGATAAQGSSSSSYFSASSYSTNPAGNTSYSTYSPSPQIPQRTSIPPASFPSPKTYTDNAMNRKLGRVGLEIGTAVHSKNDNRSPIKSSLNHLNESGFGATPQTAQKTSTAALAVSPKTYVDNAMNRKLGQVGLEIGTALNSKNDNSNTFQQHLCRAEFPMESCVTSRGSPISNGSPYIGSSIQADCDIMRDRLSLMRKAISEESLSPGSISYSDSSEMYVDNSFNSRQDQEALHFESSVSNRSSSAYSDASGARGSSPNYSSHEIGDGLCSSMPNYDGNSFHSSYSLDPPTSQKTLPPAPFAYYRTCKYSEFNTMYGLYSTIPHNVNLNGNSSVCRDYQTARKTLARAHFRYYKAKNNRESNATLGCDGLGLTTALHSKRDSSPPKHHPTPNFLNDSGTSLPTPQKTTLPELANDLSDEKVSHSVENSLVINLQQVVPESHYEDLEQVVQFYSEEIEPNFENESNIPFEDFEADAFRDVLVLEKIGSGRFREVWKAEWNNRIVALKKIRVQQVSKKRLNDMKDEVSLYGTLQHDNIVTFFGAYVAAQYVCIVMELMEMSLCEALHKHDFTDEDLLSIMLQSTAGLGYLHGKKIAHCDFKTANVLLNYYSDEEGSVCKVKITDTGLSIIMRSNETQSHVKGSPFNTPMYAAPEVLRGERLSVSKMQIADIYSLGLVFYEIVCMTEPFCNMSFQQLREQVGEKGITPEIPTKTVVCKDVLNLLYGCWNFYPDKRMTANQVRTEVESLKHIFE